MFQFRNHSEFFNQPILLATADLEDPQSVIQKFFEDYKLTELRDFVSQTNYLCMVSNLPPFDDPEERANILLYHHRLEELYEALSLLAKLGYVTKIGNSSKSE